MWGGAGGTRWEDRRVAENRAAFGKAGRVVAAGEQMELHLNGTDEASTYLRSND